MRRIQLLLAPEDRSSSWSVVELDSSPEEPHCGRDRRYRRPPAQIRT
jgi:hypothetical protein